MRTHKMKTIDQKIIAAKALRSSFNATQRDLVQRSYSSDESLLRDLREAQKQYKCFVLLTDEIKEENEDLYMKEIVGV